MTMNPASWIQDYLAANGVPPHFKFVSNERNEGSLSLGEIENSLNYRCELYFYEQYLGKLTSSSKKSDDIALYLAPYLYLWTQMKEHDFKALESWYGDIFLWLQETKKLAPELCHWTGIYIHPDALGLEIKGLHQEDLIVGPYIGEPTEHMKIPLSQGMCGLAFREKRIINLGDVHQDPRHIACSLKTQSELVIPLVDERGVMVAELDIDSHTPYAFTSDLEKRFVAMAASFPKMSAYRKDR